MAIRVHLASLLFLATVPLTAQTTPASVPKARIVQAPTTSSKPVPKQPTPTVFQADEGDRWMLLGKKTLIFKVDPVTTGSDTLVVGTEEMPPGNRIPTHKHLYEDEVLFVHKGAVRVTLAGRQYDAATGATVFIPHGNWIGVENTSSEPAMILFFFNKPAFEQCLRALSSRPGETFTMPPPEKMAAVEKDCHQVMKE
jgi:quercetin dioxygenase-like cupin family protein